jgi:hypothetical protein
MYRGFLIAVVAGVLLLNGSVGIAAASTPSSSPQLCYADVDALRNLAQHAPMLTPTLRATIARLTARYEHDRAGCSLSIRIPTGGGGYDSVAVMTTVSNPPGPAPIPAVAIPTSTGDGHTLMYAIGAAAVVVFVAAGFFYRRSLARRGSSTSQ